MSNNDTEEKELAPTDHKLRKAREKGQVAQSQDFVGACTTTIGIFFLIFSWPLIVNIFDSVLNNSVNMMGTREKSHLVQSLITTIYEAGYLSLMLLVVLVVIGVGANILQKQGVPFSLHPIKPDFNKISPSAGFKKIFARRNATEFGISFVRLIIWFSVSILIALYFLQDILASAMCQDVCLLDQVNQVMIILIASVIILLMFAGLADLPLQTILFKHEQKMGHKELKRELKDTMGNPEFRSHRKYEHQNMLDTSLDKSEPSFYLVSGNIAVALFYDPVEAPVPRLMGKYQAEEAVNIVTTALKSGSIVINNSELAIEISRSVQVNQPILERQLIKVAMLMVREGIV